MASSRVRSCPGIFAPDLAGKQIIGRLYFLRCIKAQRNPVILLTCMVGQNGNNANIPLDVLTMVTQMTTKATN